MPNSSTSEIIKEYEAKQFKFKSLMRSDDSNFEKRYEIAQRLLYLSRHLAEVDRDNTSFWQSMVEGDEFILKTIQEEKNKYNYNQETTKIITATPIIVIIISIFIIMFFLT